MVVTFAPAQRISVTCAGHAVPLSHPGPLLLDLHQTHLQAPPALPCRCAWRVTLRQQRGSAPPPWSASHLDQPLCTERTPQPIEPTYAVLPCVKGINILPQLCSVAHIGGCEGSSNGGVVHPATARVYTLQLPTEAARESFYALIKFTVIYNSLV